MNIELHLRIVGALLVALIAVNFIALRRYAWVSQLRRLETLTRQVFWVHMAFILLVLAFMAVLCLGYPRLLMDAHPLANGLVAALAIFWGVRLLIQLFVYDASIWRGKRFETAMHLVFTGLWTYFTGVFSCAWWMHP